MRYAHHSQSQTWAAALLAILIVVAGSLVARADDAEDAYRRARRDLNRAAYERAVEGFAKLRGDFPDSRFAPEALYWEAFSRARMGEPANLEQALGLLEEQRLRFPDATTLGDARELALRIETQLAKAGDAAAAYRVTRDAERLADKLARVERHQLQDADAPDPEEELRLTALNALMQMDSERALPILKRVLADHDKSSPALRARALFMLAQHDDPEVAALLVRILKEDPDPDVRRAAVFYLGQSGGVDALSALKTILADKEAEPGLREQALFAISQQPGDEPLAILREVARDSKASTETRLHAIGWIGQAGGSAGVKTLRELYDELEDPEIKEQLLFALSQTGKEGQAMLLKVARDKKENMALRSRAIFWAGQLGSVPVDDIYGLYREAEDREMKEQVIFTLSQQGGDAAVEKLMEIFRQEQDPELRTRIVFWIGQSKHPKAVEFLEEILNK